MGDVLAGRVEPGIEMPGEVVIFLPKQPLLCDTFKNCEGRSDIITCYFIVFALLCIAYLASWVLLVLAERVVSMFDACVMSVFYAARFLCSPLGAASLFGGHFTSSHCRDSLRVQLATFSLSRGFDLQAGWPRLMCVIGRFPPGRSLLVFGEFAMQGSLLALSLLESALLVRTGRSLASP